jgi:hypothetical protein
MIVNLELMEASMCCWLTHILLVLRIGEKCDNNL